jgi:predicted SnoaL-like aldol condensation-catalyzing enzyme
MKLSLSLLTLTAFACAPMFSQEPVVGVDNPEALFHDKDKKLDRNKQAAYHIELDLLECNHWNEADKWLTEAYHQHNPNAASGRAGVIAYFSRNKPTPLPDKMKTKIVAVVAEGDYVTVITPRSYPDPRDPSKTYYTTWFDMWRFVDGKADEHWDPATIAAPNPNAKGKQ